MVAKRKTPTPTNGGSSDGTSYVNAVDAEVEALWTCVPTWLTSVGGSANVITAASDPTLVAAITAYSRPMAFWLVPVANNTSTVTINIDTIGAVNLLDKDGNGLASGALVASRLHLITCDGSNFRVFSSPTPAINPTPAPDVILQEQQAQGTDAGGFTSGSWQIRNLNTSVRNVISGSSFSSNVLTLPAGTYCVEWSAPAYQINSHMSRLFNVTDSAVVGTGTSEQSSATGAIATTRSTGKVVFTITTSKSVRVEHFCTGTQGTHGLGGATGIATETYCWLHVYKIA